MMVTRVSPEDKATSVPERTRPPTPFEARLCTRPVAPRSRKGKGNMPRMHTRAHPREHGPSRPVVCLFPLLHVTCRFFAYPLGGLYLPIMDGKGKGREEGVCVPRVLRMYRQTSRCISVVCVFIHVQREVSMCKCC
jgi:hypothetical protein